MNTKCEDCGRNNVPPPRNPKLKQTVCRTCAAKRIENRDMVTQALPDNRQQIENRKANVGYADRVKANRMKRLNRKRKRPKRR